MQEQANRGGYSTWADTYNGFIHQLCVFNHNQGPEETLENMMMTLVTFRGARHRRCWSRPNWDHLGGARLREWLALDHVTLITLRMLNSLTHSLSG